MITFEDKMKNRDNEFLYDKCIKQHDYIARLQLKYEELKDRINKAIEYLKENACYENTISELFCDDLDTDSCMELLNILRGENDDSTI